jgi:hypothetical protein
MTASSASRTDRYARSSRPWPGGSGQGRHTRWIRSCQLRAIRSAAWASADEVGCGEVEQQGAVQGGGELDGQHVQVGAQVQLSLQDPDVHLGQEFAIRLLWAGGRPGRRGRCSGVRSGRRSGPGRRRSCGPAVPRPGPAAGARPGPAAGRRARRRPGVRRRSRRGCRTGGTPCPCPGRVRPARPWSAYPGLCSASIWRAVASRCHRLRAASAGSACALSWVNVGISPLLGRPCTSRLRGDRRRSLPAREIGPGLGARTAWCGPPGRCQRGPGARRRPARRQGPVSSAQFGGQVRRRTS